MFGYRLGRPTTSRTRLETYLPRTTFIFVLLIASVLPGCAADTLNPVPSWAIGFWHGILDEDSPSGPFDYMEFRSDGTVKQYGYCRGGEPTGGEVSQFHLSGGDIYLTAEIAGKGPVALVFRPNSAKTRLTYTSPRTRNNAVYEHRAANPCKVG
jgi:hypothetical protein